ncbi:hypothetical protein DBR40_05510 [Pedobacter sp. KBW01]|nr:hypothetical protein DBR40_05510 [Pedobacter sp. KBW01]
MVTDATGKNTAYFTFNGNLGFGGGIGIDVGAIKPSGGNQFLVGDFAGSGGSYNVSINTPLRRCRSWRDSRNRITHYQ